LRRGAKKVTGAERTPLTEVKEPVDEDPGEVRRRRPVKRLVALVLLVLVLLALLILWTQRRPIATDYIEKELARRGVQATYQVTRIGFRTERLENLVIGDPRRPDLTARWVEVKLSWGLRRPKVSLITARGVRLNARLVKGKVRMGQVDRLLPPPSGLPFRFPDQQVDIAGVAIRFDTPAGRVGIGLEGRGNLAGGFRGRMAARAPALALGKCGIDRLAGLWAVGIDALRPSFEGPLRAESFACGKSVAVARPQLEVKARLAQALDAWSGKAEARARIARFGPNSLAALAGRLSFDGNTADTRGALDFGSAEALIGSVHAARTAIEGRYGLSLDTGRFSLMADAAGRRMAGGKGTLAPVVAALGSAGGTPLEPIGDRLAASLSSALRGFDASASLKLVAGPGIGGVRFERLSAVSRSGARLGLGGGEGVTYYWPSGLARIDGDFALSGGGFPAVRLSLNQPGVGQPIRGAGRIAPMRVGSASLALGEIRFTAAPGGTTRIETVATIAGPLDDGRVEGLVLPIAGRIDGRGGFVFGEGCVDSLFRRLRIGSLVLGPTRLPLCPIGRALVWKSPDGAVQGGATLTAPRFAGKLGQSPLNLASSRVRFDLAGRSFTGADIALALGRAGSVSRLEIASLAGRFSGPGVGGAYSGLSGKLANVPLLLSEGAGSWRVRNGDLFVEGGLTVADEMQPPRFYPLRSDDVRLALVDNVITASGWLHDPQTGTGIVQADIRHALRTGQGRALLEVPGIRFDKGYQPEELTRLTTGVVALVDGVLKGQGEISWDGGGSRSSGTFSTEKMNLAASFGPVEGLTTTIHFTDLLGLATAPGQLAEVDAIRTGINVFDGRIRYQLLPGLQVKVEGGRWPFAGGELFLEETILDFSKPSPKRLTFRVEGLDAALFVQQMEFSNISATGTFDGVIPMVFDERGGRIVGGHLVARREGGTLSYIGELTDKELGVYGKLAFDALKSMRYSKLIVDLNGALDGEFVAGIQLDGVARDPVLTTAPSSGGLKGLVAGRALGQLAKIPFKFNITIRGPFRAVMATARSFEDPTNLIQSVLPEMLRDKPAIPPVQPQESETVR
jgi:translocation and assembly module TamB